MDNSLEKLKRIKVDSLYGKKKHFNAADRKEKFHYLIGIPLIILNLILGSVLFYVLTDGAKGSLKYVPLVLTLITTLLSSFQTYFNLPKVVEGHRRIASHYLSIMKKCDRLHGYYLDGKLPPEDFIDRMEAISLEIEMINSNSEAFPTNTEDYVLAKTGIEQGEEEYSERELSL